MKTNRKQSGFFIVELLIVLVIVGILVLAMLPNLQTYVQRAKFVDNLTAANSLKAAVELCALNAAGDPGVPAPVTAPNPPFASCSGSTPASPTGIPANVANGYGGYVDGLSTAGGIITATSTSAFGPPASFSYTYILTPTLTAHGVITWAKSGTCTADPNAAGLC